MPIAPGRQTLCRRHGSLVLVLAAVLAAVLAVLVASVAPVAAGGAPAVAEQSAAASGADAGVASAGDERHDRDPDATARDGAASDDWGPTRSGAALGGGAATQAAPACAQSSPPDHADPEGDTADVVGWVEGTWYDEPIAVDEADGLNASERERVTERTAARVETLRCLTFDALPPVEVQTRAEYGDEIGDELENESERSGTLLSATASSMLLVSDDERWTDVQAEVLTAGVGAYYDPETEEIATIVADSGDVPREPILAHELVHALQDQHHDIERFDSKLQSRYDAETGVVEGEATLLQLQYSDRCDGGAWSASCAGPDDPASPELPEYRGVLFLFQQPYLYGPAFVDGQRAGTGWDGVGDLYEDVPEHSVHVVAPETYGSVDVTLPEIDDRSTDEWQRVTAEDRPDYEVVGQAALTTTFLAPDVDPRVDGSVVSLVELADPTTGRFSNYDQPETSGWRGDRLVAYSNDEDVASVWALDWVNATEAERFRDAYAELLGVYGAEPVEGDDGVYTFEESDRFDRAVSLRIDGNRVSIVTAPTVEALSAVHDVDRSESDGDGTDDGLPGPGLAGAALAVLVAALVLARRS